MSFETFERCLATVPKHVRIHFSGMADPWLNPEATRMVMHAHRRGHRIAIYTACAGMSRDDIDAVKGLPFEAFVVHLPDTERLTRIPSDEKHLGLLAYLATSGIEHLKFMTVGTVHPEARRIVGGRVSELTPIDRAGNVEGVAPPPVEKKGPILCMNCSDHLDQNVVLPNGDVLLCCMDYGMEHVVGNLLATDYATLLKSEALRRLRRALRDDSIASICRRCSRSMQPTLVNRTKRFVVRSLPFHYFA